LHLDDRHEAARPRRSQAFAPGGSGRPDPFDRLLLAQAMCEPLHLLTSDHGLAQYSRELVIEV
jgi:PIN domain nuclease of toxin-antitoxin system